jgi:hypothetical protein
MTSMIRSCSILQYFNQRIICDCLYPIFWTWVSNFSIHWKLISSNWSLSLRVRRAYYDCLRFKIALRSTVVLNANSNGIIGLRSVSYCVALPDLVFNVSTSLGSGFFFSSLIAMSMVMEGSISLSQSSSLSKLKSRLKVLTIVCSTRWMSLAYF